MSRPLVNEDYLKFRIWLDTATRIDPFDFADWMHDNAPRLMDNLEEGWSQDDVYSFLREAYASEHRLNVYPKELQS